MGMGMSPKSIVKVSPQGCCSLELMSQFLDGLSKAEADPALHNTVLIGPVSDVISGDRRRGGRVDNGVSSSASSLLPLFLSVEEVMHIVGPLGEVVSIKDRDVFLNSVGHVERYRKNFIEENKMY